MPADALSHPDIESLSLYQNALSTLPDALWQLSKLTVLNLGDNQLKAIPDGIG